MSQHPESHVRSLALERGPESAYQAYNETAFRHFLTIEKKRAARSGRIVLLLLVGLREGGGSAEISPSLAATLFAALTVGVREVDFIGWYRTDRVVGAVLTQGAGAMSSAALTGVNARVGALLRDHLPSGVGARLDIRVVHLAAVSEV